MEAFTSGLLALEQALQRMLALVSPLAQTETVALEQAAGRITATDITPPRRARLCQCRDGWLCRAHGRSDTG